MRWRELLIGLSCYCCLFLLSAPVTQAQILSVDFQNSNGVSVPGVTPPGFVAFDNTHATGGSGATAYGQFNVALTGMEPALDGLFNRGGVTNGGSLTLADVYNDFAFNNDGTPSSLTLTLAGSGIRPNTNYDLTFYSYDDLGTAAAHSVAYTGTAGTSGSAGPLAYTTGVDPTTDGQYASTGTFTANVSGVLTINMVDTNPGGNDGIRFNALQIDGPAAPLTGPTALRVDFDDLGPSPTETGFASYEEVGSPGTRSFATTLGTLDVTVSGHQTGVVGGFFDRGVPADSGGFTFGELYRDYAFRNDNGTITVEIDGLEADTLYELTWYIYDRNNGDTPFGTIGPDDAGNTTGDILTWFYDGNLDPVSDDQYAFTGIWSSSDTNLEFDITGTSGDRVRINGFELRPVLAEVVPEPASIALWSLVGIVLAGYGFLRRRMQ